MLRSGQHYKWRLEKPTKGLDGKIEFPTLTGKGTLTFLRKEETSCNVTSPISMIPWFISMNRYTSIYLQYPV